MSSCVISSDIVKGEVSYRKLSLCINTLGGMDESRIRFRIINTGFALIHSGGRRSWCRKHVCPRLF